MTAGTLSVRRPARWGLAALLCLVLGFGLWSAAARLEGAIIAQGLVEVERSRQVVQHPEGGVVAEVAVTEGQSLRAGEVILRLDGAALRSELAIVEAQRAEISARMARLEAERDGAEAVDFPAELLTLAAIDPETSALLAGERRQFADRRASLTEHQRLLALRQDQGKAQVAGIVAQSAALGTQIALIAAEQADQEALLGKGLTQAERVRALQREAARLRGQAGELAAALAQAEGQVTGLDLERAALVARRAEEASAELGALRPDLRELTERQLALTERINRLEVRAPMAGVVLGLQVTTPQSVLRAADPILYLIPQDRPLVISARIAPTDVEAVHPGQAAELVVSAFADRDRARLAGRVTRVSADALTDPQTGQAYFVAELELDTDAVARLGPGALVPGMPVEVFLRTGGRSPLTYLLTPLADHLRRAFRET